MDYSINIKTEADHTHRLGIRTAAGTGNAGDTHTYLRTGVFGSTESHFTGNNGTDGTVAVKALFAYAEDLVFDFV
jgi:hypothetical protein